MTALWVAVAFLLGLVSGVLLREGIEVIRRKDELMRLKRLTLRVQQPNVLAVALLVVLVLNAFIGVVVIVNSGNQSQLVQCIAAYNEKSGNARDDRTNAQAVAADAELANVRADLAFQQSLENALAAEQPLSIIKDGLDQRMAITQRYLKTLEQQKKVRLDSAYPPPDLCGGT